MNVVEATVVIVTVAVTVAVAVVEEQVTLRKEYEDKNNTNRESSIFEINSTDKTNKKKKYRRNSEEMLNRLSEEGIYISPF